LFLNGGNGGNSGPNRDPVEVRRNQTLRRRPRRFRVDRSGPSGINPADFRMMPIADVKEARYGATIKVTRKNRENA